MNARRREDLLRLTRRQIANAITQDIEGGEALMKEVWEAIEEGEETRTVKAEMQRIVTWLEGAAK